MSSNDHLKVILLALGALALSSALLALPPETMLIGLVGLIFGIFMLLLALRNLSYAFASWFLLVPFFSKQGEVKNALDLGLANMSPERLLFILIGTLFLANVCLRKFRVLPVTHIEKTMVGFCLVVLISLWIHGNFERHALGFLATSFTIPMLAFFLAKNLLRGEHEVTILMWLLFGLGAYLGVTGVFEFFRVERFIFPGYIANLNIGMHAGRARGPFLQAATNGTAIGMLLFTGIYLYPRARSWRMRILIISLAGMMLLGVIFSLTRGAWVGTIVGLLLVAILYRSLRQLLLSGVIIVAVSLPVLLPVLESYQPRGLVSERAVEGGTVYYRLNTWLTGVEMFWQQPLFGIGFRRYIELNALYQTDDVLSQSGGLQLEAGGAAHNTYIELAAELGLIGLIPYGVILASITMMSIHLYRSLPAAPTAAKELILVFWGAASTYLISSFFYTQNSLFLTSVFFALAGIISRRSALVGMKPPPPFNSTRTVTGWQQRDLRRNAGWQRRASSRYSPHRYVVLR
jgi:O-antigen ligase